MVNSKAKIERKSFFKYAGVIAVGIGTVISNPLKLLNLQKENKSSLKITQNPNAVRRSTNDRGANG